MNINASDKLVKDLARELGETDGNRLTPMDYRRHAVEVLRRLEDKGYRISYHIPER